MISDLQLFFNSTISCTLKISTTGLNSWFHYRLISYFDARNQARKEKKISEANQEIQRATKYIQQYPNNWLVYLYRAAAYLNRGSITKNVNQYAKVITTDLQSAENLVNNAMRKNPDDLSVLVEHMYCYIFISLVYGRYNNTVQENRTINIADRDFLRIDKEYDLLQDFNEIKYKYNGADRRKLLDTYISIYEDRIYMYKFVNKIFYKRYSTSRYQQVEQKIKVLNKKLKELKKTSL